MAVEDAIVNKFGGAGQGGDYPAAGFGDMDSALRELGISEANPLELVRSPTHGPPTAALKNPTQTSTTFFGHFFDQDEITRKAIVVHEMAHQWDYVHNRELHRQMHDWINWGEPVSWKDASEIESFAYAVEYYFWMERDESRFWTDDLGSGLHRLANDPYYGGRGRDGLRLDPGYESILLKDRWPSATGTEQIYDRYDWLECEFTAKNCKL